MMDEWRRGRRKKRTLSGTGSPRPTPDYLTYNIEMRFGAGSIKLSAFIEFILRRIPIHIHTHSHTYWWLFIQEK